MESTAEQGDEDDDHDVRAAFPQPAEPTFEELNVRVRAFTRPVLETGEVGEALALGGAYYEQQMDIPEPALEAGFNGEQSDQEVSHGSDEHVASRDELVASRDELVASRDELVASRDELVASKDEPVARRGELVASRDEHVPREEELTQLSSTPREATTPESTSPSFPVESSVQANSQGMTTTNPSANPEFVLEMNPRKFTPVGTTNSEVNHSPSTRPRVQQLPTEANRSHTNESDADRQDT